MPMTRQKKRRLEAIGDLITEYPSIGSQAERVDRLREIGITATQSSISRDLQELGIKRVKGRYVLKPWREVGAGDFEGVLGFIQPVRPSGPYLTVITTSPNAAQMVADAMESENWPEVSGILAGSGTLFVATARQEDQNSLLDRFRAFLKRSGPPGVDHAGRPPDPEEPDEEEEEEKEEAAP